MFNKEINLIYKNLNKKDNENNVNKLDLKKSLEGVILENNDDFSSYDLEKILFFKSKGITVLNALKWCELELIEYPSENKYIRKVYSIYD